MTRRSKAILVVGAGVAVLLLAGCGKPAGRHARTTPTTSSSTRSTPAASPAGEVAALDAVAVAPAFTAAVCPYSWRDPVPYGQRLDTALARWGTPGFAAARRWSPARTATAAAGLTERQAEQACGQVTGGLEPEADPAGGQVAVRLSVTVTARAQAAAPSTAQQVFNLQLVHHDAAWLISSGQW
jgi:hypothetical protein